MKHFPSQLFDIDVWQLKIVPEHLCSLIEKLASVTLATHSHGVMSLGKKKSILPMLIDEMLMFPEAGQAIQLDSKSSVYLRSGKPYHKDITLEIAVPNRPESLTISFNQSPTNLETIREFAKLVVSSIDKNSLPIAALQYPQSCPCCKEKRDSIRRCIDIHPLYHVVRSIDQSQAIYFSHQGVRTQSSQELSNYEVLSHQGVLYLRNDHQHCSLDLTHIYNVHLIQNPEKNQSGAQLTAFNSFGTKVLTLEHPDPKNFQNWSSILDQQKVH